MHAACHTTSSQKLGSCTALSSSSRVIEASKLVTVEIERLHLGDRLQGHVACRLCTHYIDDLVPYAPLELCSYWGCGQVFHYNDSSKSVLHLFCIILYSVGIENVEDIIKDLEQALDKI